MAGSGTRFMFRSAFIVACGITFALAASDRSEEAARVMMARTNAFAVPVSPSLGLTAEAVAGAAAEPLESLSSVDAVVITSLAEDGPAARAGVDIGDIALRINGLPIRGRVGLLTLLDHRGPARLEMLRHGVTRRITVG